MGLPWGEVPGGVKTSSNVCHDVMLLKVPSQEATSKLLRVPLQSQALRTDVFLCPLWTLIAERRLSWYTGQTIAEAFKRWGFCKSNGPLAGSHRASSLNEVSF